MPDIREILNALSPDDKALWSEHRTVMRRAYLTAHNETVGMANWDANDDAFMDLIDIKLAILYDRSGKLIATKEIIGNDYGQIEEDIKQSSPITLKLPAGTTIVPSGDEKIISNASNMLADMKIEGKAASAWPVKVQQ